MDRIFVLGAYGCGNRGDDAILQSITENFRDYEVYATCGSYENIESWLPVKKIPCRLNEGFSFPILICMIKSSVKIVEAIRKSKALIFGGGSLIHDLTPYNLPFLYLWHLVAKALKKQVFYFCIGVGPLKSDFGKFLSKKFLSHADGLFVRDLRSLSYCQELGTENAVLVKDGAFLVKTRNQCGKKTLLELGLIENEYACVTASQWFESSNFWNRSEIDFSNAVQNFIACVKMFQTCTGKRIVFVPTVFHDQKIGTILQDSIEGEITLVPPDYTSKQMAEVIENCWFLMAVRMHSMIFAARQGVPFLPLIYDEKVRQLLLLLGMEQYGLNLSNITPCDILGTMGIMLEQYDNIRANLLSKAENFYKENLNAVAIIQKN